MALREPKSMEELVYFTSRDIGKGEATVWVFRGLCPACGKGIMGKPKDKKGKVIKKAKEFTCPLCSHTMPETEYEETLAASIRYTCPACMKKGESEVPFKRKKIAGKETLRFQCQACQADIDITKKMK